MACRQVNRTLLDASETSHEYYVIQKPASEGEKLKFKLIAMLGPALGELKGLKLDATAQDDIMSSFGKAITALFEKNDPDTVFDFLQGLVIGSTRDGVRIDKTNFDEIYTDNSVEFYKAVALVLEVNFANFFKGLKLNGMLAKMKDVIATPPV